MQSAEIKKVENIYSVSRLTNEVRFLLEDTFPSIWVEGEISNFSAPNSGHWYFCLKDSSAQVRCAMFRGSQRKLNFSAKDGMHVLVKARISMYEARGEFQLIVDDMEERGEGKLRRAFELLKKKLESAGLFDPLKKKPLPAYPHRIGVVTSATGAAIRDILHVLRRRYPVASVIIYHTLVQGETAAPTIVAAIETANRRNECDILIVARGGGSLEDLWPFNEEIVAYAIHHSQLPIISGVGHEIDFTIADFVADVRAPTPSAAAEMITPDATELLQMFANQHKRMCHLIRQKFQNSQNQLEWMQKHLSQQHPKRRLTEKMQKLDFCELHLVQLQNKIIHGLQHKLKVLDSKLHQCTPRHTIQQLKNQLNFYQAHLNSLITKCFTQKHNEMIHAAAKLDTMSPLATLNRGYALASKNEQVLRNVADVSLGDEINVQLAQGKLNCRVMKITSD